RISTESGNISLTGTVRAGVTFTNRSGIQIRIVDGITSSSGNITLSGINNSSGSGSDGVSLNANLDTGTSGKVTFSGTAGTGNTGHGVLLQGSFSRGGGVEFINCLGAINVGYGISAAAPLTTAGNVAATDNIR